MAAAPERRRVLVTVGTTQFDRLVGAVAAESFLSGLAALRFGAIRVQVGRGAAPPGWAAEGVVEQTPDGLERSWFRFTPDLPAEIAQVTAFFPSLPIDRPRNFFFTHTQPPQADLVLSHAGAGSIMEVGDASQSNATS